MNVSRHVVVCVCRIITVIRFRVLPLLYWYYVHLERHSRLFTLQHMPCTIYSCHWCCIINSLSFIMWSILVVKLPITTWLTCSYAYASCTVQYTNPDLITCSVPVGLPEKCTTSCFHIFLMLMTLADVMPHTDINPNTNCAIINFKKMMWCTFHVDPLQLGFGIVRYWSTVLTRSSADADNRLDAFSGQSRSTNMVPFHM